MHDKCFELIRTIADNTEEFIAIYENNTLCFTNSAFNSFFSVTSSKDFLTHFETLESRFVPHPSYFNSQKIPENTEWFDAILDLEENDRIVSFLSQTHNPHAFSVTVDKSVAEYVVVTFQDITQSLIKRILIENNMNIDEHTKAYRKDYFLHIKQSFEDAARFNQKLIGFTIVEASDENSCNPASLVQTLKNHTRNDDMIIAWDTNKFLIAYLVDDAMKAGAVDGKLRHVLQQHAQDDLKYSLSSTLQKEQESISRMINRFAA